MSDSEDLSIQINHLKVQMIELSNHMIEIKKLLKEIKEPVPIPSLFPSPNLIRTYGTNNIEQPIVNLGQVIEGRRDELSGHVINKLFPYPSYPSSSGPFDLPSSPFTFPDRKCPNSHPLNGSYSTSNLQCDQCHKPIQMNTEIISCRTCDYDLCKSCMRIRNPENIYSKKYPNYSFSPFTQTIL